MIIQFTPYQTTTQPKWMFSLVQIILAAKWLVRHSRTSLNQQGRPLPSLLSLSFFHAQNSSKGHNLSRDLQQIKYEMFLFEPSTYFYFLLSIKNRKCPKGTVSQSFQPLFVKKLCQATYVNMLKQFCKRFRFCKDIRKIRMSALLTTMRTQCQNSKRLRRHTHIVSVVINNA